MFHNRKRPALGNLLPDCQFPINASKLRTTNKANVLLQKNIKNQCFTDTVLYKCFALFTFTIGWWHCYFVALFQIENQPNLHEALIVHTSARSGKGIYRGIHGDGMGSLPLGRRKLKRGIGNFVESWTAYHRSGISQEYFPLRNQRPGDSHTHRHPPPPPPHTHTDTHTQPPPPPPSPTLWDNCQLSSPCIYNPPGRPRGRPWAKPNGMCIPEWSFYRCKQFHSRLEGCDRVEEFLDSSNQNLMALLLLFCGGSLTSTENVFNSWWLQNTC